MFCYLYNYKDFGDKQCDQGWPDDLVFSYKQKHVCPFVFQGFQKGVDNEMRGLAAFFSKNFAVR